MTPRAAALLACFGLAACDAAAPASSGAMSLVAVTPGTNLPYGQLATACDTPEGALGSRIAVASGYALYDTAPNSTAQRTHYVTGFRDNCPRQFTAALALFGDAATHETTRYGGAADETYSPTDTAYEQIKASFCGAQSGQPCGARIDALSKRTAFLTVYRSFGGAKSWADVLLSDGEVVAMDFAD